MAWNDVYQDDNALHLVIMAGGRKYDFSKRSNGAIGVDLKVERKIGDTLSKFSLGIIDDGSDDYIQFERVILNKFTNIEVEYGNSSKNKCKCTGFIVDYQPVFFGPSSKLTVTGYLTRKKAGTPEQSSAYTYYIDWTPLIGKRKNNKKNWDEIYNGNFSFKKSADGTKLNDKPLIDPAQADEYIKEQLDNLISQYTEGKTLVETRIKDILLNDPLAIFKSPYSNTYENNGKPIDTTKYINNKVEDVILNEDGTITITWEDGIVDYGVGIGAHKSIIGEEAFIAAQQYFSAKVSYTKIYKQLTELVTLDTYGNAAGTAYAVGHVPWNFDMIMQYSGNVIFEKFSHPQDSTRSIARVSPDLFIEWDNDLPCQYNYLGEDGLPTTKKWDVFPDNAINDIKVFGLKFYYNNLDEKERGVTEANYQLQAQDMHGVYRVFKAADGKMYIYVGDIPQLYKKWKDSNWKYNEGEDKSTGDVTYQTYSFNSQYYKDDHIINDQYDGGWHGTTNKKKGRAQKDFISRKKEGGWSGFWDNLATELNNNWKKEVDDGNIIENETSGSESTNKGSDYRTYKITELKEDKENNVKAMSPETRITKYLQAAYRSACPIKYGKIYISDIVAQLCALEGWKNPYIVSTTATSYKSGFLNMEGMSALTYIATVLCPNAVEEGGMGRSGFTCYFDAVGKFHFEPENLKYNNKTVMSLGYNIKNSSVISFTVRSRGQALMLGVDATDDTINPVTGDNVSASSKSGLEQSATEKALEQERQRSNYNPTFDFIADAGARAAAMAQYNDWKANLSNEAQFFNLALFNYYGNEAKVDEYVNFLVHSKSGDSIAYGSNLIRKSYQSSANSTTAVLKALHELNELRNTYIKAEMTIIGDNKLAPGDWITVMNYTRKGVHYTSGDYLVKTITDNMTSSGFTQTLELHRYSRTVKVMNGNETGKTYDGVVKSKLTEAMDVYIKTPDKFDEWYNTNFPNNKETEKQNKLISQGNYTGDYKKTYVEIKHLDGTITKEELF